MREREKQNARQAIDNLKRAVETAKKAGVGNKISELPQKISNFEAQYKKNNVFIYRDIIPEIQRLHEEVFVEAEKELEKQININQRYLRENEEHKNKKVQDLTDSVKKLEAKRDSINDKWRSEKGAAILAGFLIVSTFLALFLTFYILKLFSDSKDISSVITIFVFLLFAAFGVFYLFVVTIPKQKMSQKLQNRKEEVTKLKGRIESEYNETVAKTNNQINELKVAKERCQKRHYL